MSNAVDRDRSYDHLICGICNDWIYVPVTSKNHNDRAICVHSFCKNCFKDLNLSAQISGEKLKCPLCRKKIEHVVLDMAKLEETTKIANQKFILYYGLYNKSRSFPFLLNKAVKYAVAAKNEVFLLYEDFSDELRFPALFSLAKLYADVGEYDKCLSLIDKIDQLPDPQRYRERSRDRTLNEIGSECFSCHRANGEEGWVELAEKFYRKMHLKEGYALFGALDRHYQSSNQFKRAKSLMLTLKKNPRVEEEIGELNQKLKIKQAKVPCSCSLRSRVTKASRSSCSTVFWICSSVLAIFSLAACYIGYQYRRS